MCSTTCIIEAKRKQATADVVKNFHCLYLKDRVVKITISFPKSFLTANVNVLLGMDGNTVLEFSSKVKLCFTKLSQKARTPWRASDGSIGYDLQAAKEAVVPPLLCKSILTDIALSCPPGLYPRIAPRSSLASKNTNVGAGVIDFGYRENVKVLMMNHSQENLNINLGDRIDELNSISRDIIYFGSTGV